MATEDREVSELARQVKEKGKAITQATSLRVASNGKLDHNYKLAGVNVSWTVFERLLCDVVDGAVCESLLCD